MHFSHLLLFVIALLCSCSGSKDDSTSANGGGGAPSPNLVAPTVAMASNITENSFQANWSSVTGATAYLIDVATDRNFANFVAGFNGKVVNSTTIQVTDLNPETDYFYRLKSQNGNTTSDFSAVMTVKTATKQGDNPPPANFAALESFITTEMAANKVNGLAGFIIKNNQVIWKKGFGKANVAENKNVDTETVFMIASVSKTVTSVVLMTLFDQGKFKLDDDINKYLPFKVINPKFPDTPITIRMLLTHTSSIQDNSYNAIGDNITYRTGIDHPESLATFMKDCLSPDGKYYDASTLFTDKKPATATKYSNLSSSLCGYLAEIISGQNFHDYSKKVLSVPLGFKNSAWAMKDVNLSNSAIPYEDDNSVIGHYSFVDYPNGGFRTNMEDFSKYMLMLMNGGTWNGVKILEKSTMAEMYKAQALGSGEYGLKFVVNSSGSEIGHSGGEKGVTAEMYFYPQTGIGVFVTFNKDNGALSSKIYKRMVEEASK